MRGISIAAVALALAAGASACGSSGSGSNPGAATPNYYQAGQAFGTAAMRTRSDQGPGKVIVQYQNNSGLSDMQICQNIISMGPAGIDEAAAPGTVPAPDMPPANGNSAQDAQWVSGCAYGLAQ